MTTVAGYAHVEYKDTGKPMIAGTRISVARVALDHTLHHIPADDIAARYPGLSAAQVFGALAYDYDHRDEMDRRIAEDRQTAEAGRREWAASQEHLREKVARHRAQS